VDKIIRAAIEMSPHTSPNALFPATNNAHGRSLEAGKFRTPLDFQSQLRRPPEEYLIDDDDDEEEEEGEEESGEALEPEFEMLHFRTPTRSAPKV
jgi:hypothetical protein